MTANDTQDWLRRGASYRETFKGGARYDAQEAAIIAMLRPLAFDSVLEVGCGFGRITKRICEEFLPSLYVATDISTEILDGAEQYVGWRNWARPATNQSGNLAFTRFDLDDARLSGAELPVSGAGLVVCSEVLMHRPPERVEEDVRLLCALAGKYLLTCDWSPAAESTEGNYAHDYRALFAPYGLVDVMTVPQARQEVFVVKRPTATVYRAPEGTPYPAANEEPPAPWVKDGQEEALAASEEESDGQDR